MPTPMDAMLGLVIAAIGLLTVVLSFLVVDSRKRIISYVIAGIVTTVGSYYYVKSEMRGFQVRKRISNIQQQQN